MSFPWLCFLLKIGIFLLSHCQRLVIVARVSQVFVRPSGCSSRGSSVPSSTPSATRLVPGGQPSLESTRFWTPSTSGGPSLPLRWAPHPGLLTRLCLMPQDPGTFFPA